MRWISEQTASLERLALVEGGRLIEYHERMRDEIRVGTFVYAKVDRLHPTLGAAFLIATDGTPLYLPLNETVEALRAIRTYRRLDKPSRSDRRYLSRSSRKGSHRNNTR